MPKSRFVFPSHEQAYKIADAGSNADLSLPETIKAVQSAINLRDHPGFPIALSAALGAYMGAIPRFGKIEVDLPRVMKFSVSMTKLGMTLQALASTKTDAEIDAIASEYCIEHLREAEAHLRNML